VTAEHKLQLQEAIILISPNKYGNLITKENGIQLPINVRSQVYIQPLMAINGEFSPCIGSNYKIDGLHPLIITDLLQFVPLLASLEYDSTRMEWEILCRNGPGVVGNRRHRGYIWHASFSVPISFTLHHAS
jgi:hypothetical protein